MTRKVLVNYRRIVYDVLPFFGVLTAVFTTGFVALLLMEFFGIFYNPPPMLFLFCLLVGSVAGSLVVFGFAVLGVWLINKIEEVEKDEG